MSDVSVYCLQRTTSQQDQVDIEVMEDKRFTLNRKKLKPYFHFNVIAQAKMCPGNLYEGPWSEWSNATEWRTQGHDIQGDDIQGGAAKGDETEGDVTEGENPNLNHVSVCPLVPLGGPSRGFSCTYLCFN